MLACICEGGAEKTIIEILLNAGRLKFTRYELLEDEISICIMNFEGGKTMEATTVIRKIHMNCPLCDKTHEVEEKKRIACITIKGEKVSYEEHFYFCENADEDENEFATGSMTNKNLLNARNAYRIKKGLLRSEEIITF